MGATPVVDARLLMGSELVRLLRPLEAMMRWFDAAGVRAAIIGGVAASLLGKPRLTKDIDAVVLDADAEALIESGAPYGFEPRIADAVNFARNTRVLYCALRKEGSISICRSVRCAVRNSRRPVLDPLRLVEDDQVGRPAGDEIQVGVDRVVVRDLEELVCLVGLGARGPHPFDHARCSRREVFSTALREYIARHAPD